MKEFILWAQALDNSSPDHFDVGGKELAADDSMRRQEAVSSVSSVIKNGTRVYKVNGIQLTADFSHFVLEVPSAQRDRAGRTAPIVCYGNYDAEVGDALARSAAQALEEFAKRIDRTLSPEHFELVQAAFVALKKKLTMTKLARALGIGAMVVGLLAIIYWLAQRDW